ncbi:MAG: hypothetical protein ACRDDY_18915 [Clostridium sp.]|uniref:hypothetical protein n=1 Tax=Clostridium sp. TaxID=1506 RepID=UPI003EE528FB
MGLKKRLDGEYLDVYNEIMIELEVEEINALYREEVRNDILDMFLSAQDEKASVRELVGSDTRVFIEDILKSLEKGNESLLRFGQSLAIFLIGIGGIALTRIKGGVLEFTVDILFLAVVMLLGATLGRAFSKKNRIGKERRREKRKIEWTFNIGMIGVSALIVGFFNINLPILFTVNSPYIFVIGFLVIGLILSMTIDIISK